MNGSSLIGARVLVVEDEWLVSLLIADTLVDAGCIVLGPFARVADALLAVAAELFDAAVLDVNVANEKAFPIAYKLEERGIPFLFITGYGKSALPRDRPDWEAYPKPFEPAELIAALAEKLVESARPSTNLAISELN